MTALPEAKLAREAELCYATIAPCTDYDCWHEDGPRSASIRWSRCCTATSPWRGKDRPARPRPSAPSHTAAQYAVMTALELLSPGGPYRPEKIIGATSHGNAAWVRLIALVLHPGPSTPVYKRARVSQSRTARGRPGCPRYDRDRARAAGTRSSADRQPTSLPPRHRFSAPWPWSRWSGEDFAAEHTDRPQTSGSIPKAGAAAGTDFPAG